MSKQHEKSGTIYCYTCKPNGKKYIGQTWDFNSRKRHHKNCSKNKAGNGCTIFYRAIQKYGIKSFEITVLHENIDNQELLDTLECEEIKKQNSLSPFGYNLRHGGLDARMSDETKRKMSEIKRHKIKTTDIAERTYNNPDWKKKIADGARANWKNQEYVARWRASMKSSRPWLVFKDEVAPVIETKEEKDRKRKEYINRLICSCRNEYSMRMRSIAAKEKAATWRVYCFETNTVYDSATSAASVLGLDQGAISKILRGDGKSTGGYHFKKAV